MENINLEELGLEVLEVDTDTMLEDMGASFGFKGCCSIVIM